MSIKVKDMLVKIERPGRSDSVNAKVVVSGPM